MLKNVTGDHNGFGNKRSTIRFSWLVIAVTIPLMWSLFAETPLADDPPKPPAVDKTPGPAGQFGEFNLPDSDIPEALQAFSRTGTRTTREWTFT